MRTNIPTVKFAKDIVEFNKYSNDVKRICVRVGITSIDYHSKHLVEVLEDISKMILQNATKCVTSVSFGYGINLLSTYSVICRTGRTLLNYGDSIEKLREALLGRLKVLSRIFSDLGYDTKIDDDTLSLIIYWK